MNAAIRRAMAIILKVFNDALYSLFKLYSFLKRNLAINVNPIFTPRAAAVINAGSSIMP